MTSLMPSAEDEATPTEPATLLDQLHHLEQQRAEAIQRRFQAQQGFSSADEELAFYCSRLLC